MPLEYISGCLNNSGRVSEGHVEKLIIIMHSRKSDFPDYIEKITGTLNSI